MELSSHFVWMEDLHRWRPITVKTYKRLIKEFQRVDNGHFMLARIDPPESEPTWKPKLECWIVITGVWANVKTQPGALFVLYATSMYDPVGWKHRIRKWCEEHNYEIIHWPKGMQ